MRGRVRERHLSVNLLALLFSFLFPDDDTDTLNDKKHQITTLLHTLQNMSTFENQSNIKQTDAKLFLPPPPFQLSLSLSENFVFTFYLQPTVDSLLKQFFLYPLYE